MGADMIMYAHPDTVELLFGTNPYLWPVGDQHWTIIQSWELPVGFTHIIERTIETDVPVDVTAGALMDDTGI